MFGKLTWRAIPFNEPPAMAASAMIILGILGILTLVTRKGWWPYLWREWLTSVDHKRIGVMYIILALVVGGSLWIMDHLNANILTPAQMMEMQR